MADAWNAVRFLLPVADQGLQVVPSQSSTDTVQSEFEALAHTDRPLESSIAVVAVVLLGRVGC